MPYPLAHPAAVLPLQRFCPRFLSFPALLIGSLTPDVGYCFGHLHVDRFSHRFFAGVFGFCLPLGLLTFVILCLVRAPLIQMLPARYRQVFLPLCKCPVGHPLGIVLSVLIGAWTHIGFDDVTHKRGWLPLHVPMLQNRLVSVGQHNFQVSDVLYGIFTFCGVAWLALAYTCWLETAKPGASPDKREREKLAGILLASAVLFFAETSRGRHPLFGTISAGIVNLLLVMGFACWITGRKSRRI
jgi:hypothetical protein